MWRKIIAALAICFFVVLAYSLFSYAAQKPPRNWTYTLNEYSKNPFGAKIFFKEIDAFFPRKEVKKITAKDFYTYFSTDYTIDTMTPKTLLSFVPNFPFDSVDYYHNPYNYLSINRYFQANYVGANALINQAFYGSHVQLYAFNFDPNLLHRLGLKVKKRISKVNSLPNKQSQNIRIWTGDTFQLRNTLEDGYFSEIPENSDTLIMNDSNQILGIQVYLGYGSISLYTTPHIFSNYDLLNVNQKLAETLISDLPIENTYWSSRLNHVEQDTKGLLYFIFSHPTLKWAYFVLLFSLLAYFLLNLQRKQRAIPILEKPKNLSLGFLQTISDLHYSKLDYHSILLKKMNHLKAQVKVEYHLQQREVDDHYMVQLAKRSKIKEEAIRRLFRLHMETIQKRNISKFEFETLCNLFQLFKK